VQTDAVFSSMTGDVTGSLTDDQGAAELLASAEQSIAVAERPGCPRLNLHGTGEINYPAIAAALEQLGYRGTVGLEAWASGDSEQALARFRAAFTRSETHEPRGAPR
jgi:hydroxypyruvate isomerase